MVYVSSHAAKHRQSNDSFSFFKLISLFYEVHQSTITYHLSDITRNVSKRTCEKRSHRSNCTNQDPGADQGFLERGFTCIKGWWFALLILSHFS